MAPSEIMPAPRVSNPVVLRKFAKDAKRDDVPEHPHRKCIKRRRRHCLRGVIYSKLDVWRQHVSNDGSMRIAACLAHRDRGLPEAIISLCQKCCGLSTHGLLKPMEPFFLTNSSCGSADPPTSGEIHSSGESS